MKAESAATGLRNILIATAVAGIIGYAIQLLAPALLPGDAAYIAFSVYWSTVYLCVAALSGVQQEVTRATRPAAGDPSTPVLRQFTWLTIVVTVVVVSIIALLFGRAVLPGPTLLLTGTLLVGVVGYILVAVLSGVLYGLRRWTAVAGLTIIDAGLRAILVVAALAFGVATEWIALAVSLPFGLAFVAVWAKTRSKVVGAFRLDVDLRALVGHASGTVTAAAAMGLMMNGLPMLLGLTSRGFDQGALAGLILAITLTRAPIVVPLLALQSYFISIFRGGGRTMLRRILIALSASAGGAAALTAASWLLGPWVIGLVSSGRFEIAGSTMAVITASAGLVALMCITGPALISVRRHIPYAAGWVLAAGLTVLLLALPTTLDQRLWLALLVPPALGLSTHVVALLRRGVFDPREVPTA